MKRQLVVLVLGIFICKFVIGQSKTQFHLNLSYTAPFEKENNFDRIGSILGIKTGLTFGLEKDRFIGIDFSSSLFFPPGGGQVGSPTILPQGKFKFSNSKRLWVEMAVGALYNPSSIGIEGNISYNLEKIGNDKNIFSVYANGVSQTFDNPINENKTNAPISWLGTVGLKYIKPINRDFTLIFKPGIGLRGDGDEDNKFVANASVVFVWKYFSVIGAYTNKVPQRAFPTYFVLSAEFDAAKFIYNLRSNATNKRSARKASPGLYETVVISGYKRPKYHENILSY